MQVQLHFQDIRHSLWMDQFLEKRLARLERFLPPTSVVHLNLKFDNERYHGQMLIHHPLKEYAFSGEGASVIESFMQLMDRAVGSLSDQRRKMKAKMRRGEMLD